MRETVECDVFCSKQREEKLRLWGMAVVKRCKKLNEVGTKLWRFAVPESRSEEKESGMRIFTT